MPSVTRNFGTFVDDAGVGTATWSSPGNAAASDDSRATVGTGGSSVTTHYLKATAPAGTAVPTGATIDGIEIIIERHRGTGTSVLDNRVRIVKGGVIGATDKSNVTDWPTSDTNRTYGSSTDLWGETWTEAEVNASDFGMALSVVTVLAQARVDHIQCVIYYTEAAQEVPVTQTTETDTAGAFGKQKTRSFAQATSTEEAQAFGRQKIVQVAQATETDSTDVITAQKAVTIGQPEETDEATGVLQTQLVAVGQATETDEANGIGAGENHPFTQATETDSAGAITPQKIYAVGQATETDSSQAVSAKKTSSTGQSVETDEAFSMTPMRWVFYPPTVDDVSTTAPMEQGNDLQRHFARRSRGRNVVKEDGEFTTVDIVLSTRFDAAEKVYYGGHVYYLNTADKEELEEAGYTVVLEAV